MDSYSQATENLVFECKSRVKSEIYNPDKQVVGK